MSVCTWELVVEYDVDCRHLQGGPDRKLFIIIFIRGLIRSLHRDTDKKPAWISKRKERESPPEKDQINLRTGENKKLQTKSRSATKIIRTEVYTQD